MLKERASSGKTQLNHLFLCWQAVPLLSVIEDMVQQRQGGVNARMVPVTVRLVWTAREREEFTLISETIMAAAG